MNDIQLNLEGGNEIFNYSQEATRYHLEDGEIDCLSREKNIAATELDGLIQSAKEVIILQILSLFHYHSIVSSNLISLLFQIIF